MGRHLGSDVKKGSPAATPGAPWTWPRVSPAFGAAVPGLAPSGRSPSGAITAGGGNWPAEGAAQWREARGPVVLLAVMAVPARLAMTRSGHQAIGVVRDGHMPGEFRP